MEEGMAIPLTADDIFNHLPLDHLIGISLLISILIGMVLLFSWKVIREIIKWRKQSND